jgi:uncharacterized protein
MVKKDKMLKHERQFQVFLKPAGSACNLKCSYCYYPDTNIISGKRGLRVMPGDILEKYIIDHFKASSGPDYFFSWHGGEPTLAGIDFYRRAVALQKMHQPSGANVINGIQSNGTLINDDWCRFFTDENFYVGISIDGPEDLHDLSRINAAGAPTFEKVINGYEKLINYGIRNEILCVVSNVNVNSPLEVYRFIKSLGARYVTFLPLVSGNRDGTGADQSNSVDGEKFGKFLCTVFDEWLENDIGKVSVQIIEEAISAVLKNDHTLCIFKKVCGGVPVVEMNGDFYSCDHYVDSDHLMGNIAQSTLEQLLDSEAQTAFGEAKFKTLPDYCLQCEVLDMCNGECPKNRLIMTPVGEPGLNYLCSGYKNFFNHIRPFTNAVATEWKSNKS